MLEKSLLLKAKNLPQKTGVYLFFKNDSVLYVGKAKNLRSRVLSYFNSSLKKSSILCSVSDDIQFFLVNSEKDALFLENNLIKKNKPKYNVLLKDDKSFPWLCIKNERFPRVFITRKKQNDSDFYFGPYLSKSFLKDLYGVIKDFYPVRSCNYFLSEKNINSKKYKVCLDYHLKKCLGPCEGFQDEKNYNKKIFYIKNLLEGRFSFLLHELKKDLILNSEKLLFEKCERIKNQIDCVKKLKNKSIIVCNKNLDIDSFFILSFNNYSYINFIRVVEGSVIYINNYKIKNHGLLDDVFILKSFIENTFIDYGKLSSVLISNIYVDVFLNKKIIIPKRGYKKNIIDLGFKNLLNFIDANNSNSLILDLFNLKDLLFLNNTPFIIDCFDVSTLQGSYTTASCVCFKNGKPFKKNYRSFNISDSFLFDDYLSLSEAIKKRYSGSVNYFPNLIVIDGGKGQINAAINTLKNLKLNNIDLISIAKKDEIIYLKNLKEIKLNKLSGSLKIIQNIRDEAHRFCLKKHKKRRSINFIKSELDNIPGLGKKTIIKLLKNYKSLNNIKNLSKNNLIEFLGIKKGSIVYNYFNK